MALSTSTAQYRLPAPTQAIQIEAHEATPEAIPQSQTMVWEGLQTVFHVYNE